MLEACLGNKIIRDFLKHYKQNRWQKLIPSLIEIAILNLSSSFHTLFFSEEDIHNIIQELKGNQNNIGGNHKMKKDRTHIIFSKPSHEWRTADGGVESTKSHSFRKIDSKYRDFLFDNSSISNHSISKHSNNNRKKIKNTKSKIKEQVEMDKRNYYNRRYGEDNNSYPKPKKQIEKINYAISYDKNLQPELIEKTTFNKNKRGGKKIIQKMTQEEYEQQFLPEKNQEYNENGNDDYEEGDKEDLYEENDEEEYYDPQTQYNHNYKNKFNDLNKIPNPNNQNKKRNNLYHYKNEFINQNNNNNLIVNNLKQSNNNNSFRNVEENNNVEIMQNPQQSFNPKYYKNNNEQISNEFNQERNNYINIGNNSNAQQSPNIGNKYNPISNSQYNNYRGGISESDDKSSKLIGIEKKYQKKIDELEQNILNSNDNNIDNYANKLQVNVTNMEEYKMKKGINSIEDINQQNNYNNNNMNNSNEENDEDENNNEDIQNYNNNNINDNNNNEENQISDSEMNDEGVLSQMSNMTERTKLLFKRTMDEYPPLEEDTFYDQNSLTK